MIDLSMFSDLKNEKNFKTHRVSVKAMHMLIADIFSKISMFS